MNDCKHASKRVHIPDSLASMCPDCGQIWVGDEPEKWGNITDWLDDLADAKEKRESNE